MAIEIVDLAITVKMVDLSIAMLVYQRVNKIQVSCKPLGPFPSAVDPTAREICQPALASVTGCCWGLPNSHGDHGAQGGAPWLAKLVYNWVDCGLW